MTPADLRALAERVERSQVSSDEIARGLGWREHGTLRDYWINPWSGELYRRLPNYPHDLNAIAAAWEPLRKKGWRWGCTQGDAHFLVSAWRPGRSSIQASAPTESAARLALLLRCLAAEMEAAHD